MLSCAEEKLAQDMVQSDQHQKESHGQLQILVIGCQTLTRESEEAIDLDALPMTRAEDVHDQWLRYVESLLVTVVE